MLELYPTEKFHFSSEIQVAEVEKVMISPKIPYVIYMGNKGFPTSTTCISELKWIFVVK